MWDPASYLRYGDERSRPFHDLLGRVAAQRPRTVVDLGCGPGHLTATLAARWPAARIVGLDSSAEMIAAATRAAPPAPSGAPSGGRVEFALADARTWTPDPEVDVLVCNAVLQWVPGHQELLLRWARELGPGRWLAVQVPGNFDAASHRALREVADTPRWRHLVADLLRADPVSDVAGYATLLTGAHCAVDAWETTYVHLLPASGATDHPVLGWMEGTALRPVRAALGGAGTAWDDFRAALTERLVEAYPVRHGLVQFPFRRVFFVARTGARQ
ncbi:trans-aconitate 2-methyltransferase [Plantactinospora sp. BC1]|uniref:trans-aconitate 2-methyltransferase n=1 Tax=Plantactinospora sp. BC1 TaxID=2108470 RepID=UPI000D16B846|nr:trans-aconitate 2-methyltransferase [Plantactinospora sp. BC1]AVT31970.1 trans-aconitate 2-methyltransferase [Plantactinospora sp. BC1]